ncbi:hypothetical protein NP493_820g01045 [Ridgeia piscesae]|uniref:Uncharacterized protein n=1 Tax=Ridgeia piscesae TaxID=27915 RepID=A0AAD9NP22_RIDPI|nr:hypothetical protein NP493_820g01045 [Ridgeia piscesae]
MLRPVIYKLNETHSYVPLSLHPLPSLPLSISLSLTLSLPPILLPLPLRHTISTPFTLFFPTLLCSSTPLFLDVIARHSFLTHSFILVKSHMDSVMTICTYSHERRSYLCYTKQLSGWATITESVLLSDCINCYSYFSA